ncbi:scavenger mRNA decapping enzyme [Meredithblackwellia eburnea MCA 4105]
MSPPTSQQPTFTSPADLLTSFKFDRVLSEDARSLVLYLLGTAVPSSNHEGSTKGEESRCPCIIKVERTAYETSESELNKLGRVETWDKLKMVTANDIYSTSLGWFSNVGERAADVQLSSICPATEKHIKKYSTQKSRFVRETPEVYARVTEPYIESLPNSQISWVYNILDGLAEAENVLFRDDDPESGFVLTPDLKWDQKTMSSLYLLVLSQTRAIRSLRDLRTAHLPLLKNVRDQTRKVASEKYGVEADELRMFVHYQPTYYHFHIHITHVSYVGFQGVTVGQSHLLDDIIDNLELDGNYYAKRTLTYALGTERGLYEKIAKY